MTNFGLPWGGCTSGLEASCGSKQGRRRLDGDAQLKFPNSTAL